MKQIREEMWGKLAQFLNRVADEREQDSDGPGSGPTNNAYNAQALLRELGIEGKKAPGVK